MMERNSASSGPGSRALKRALKRAPVLGTNNHAQKTQTPLGKRIRGRPNDLADLRPVIARILGDHFHARRGVVAIASCDAADPAPIDVIRVSRSGLARFDFCPQVGWEQVYFRCWHASNIKKP
jgi:hypothetical protein